MIRVDCQSYVKSQDVLRILFTTNIHISTKLLVLKKYIHFEGLPPTKYERLRDVNILDYLESQQTWQAVEKEFAEISES